MSTTIYKYQFDVADEVTLDMPTGAKVLCVQMQRDAPCVWALVDASAPLEPRCFEVYGTGHKIENVSGLQYVGTFQMRDGLLVFHLFERVT